MSDAGEDALKQVDQQLSQGNLAWLFGAGTSVDAGLPIMADLTLEVLSRSVGSAYEPILLALKAELPANSNIEHILSHLGDYVAIAKRVATSNVDLSGSKRTLVELEIAHREITNHIANIIRFGYVSAKGGAPAIVGSRDNLIVTVEHHLAFLRALFEKRQAGLREPRRPIHFFTTNYDTLLEDGLALGRYKYWDGFSGGAIAFRDHWFGKAPPTEGVRAKVVKLHGSIDWVIGSDGDVWRVRHTDKYPERLGPVYIHPQSTKYVSTQRDPFAAQFGLLRDLLGTHAELVLATCGYSYSDDHINDELERALSVPGNKTTVIAFCRESTQFPPVLTRWLSSTWGDRVYVLTEKGLYWGSRGLMLQKPVGEHDWWSLKGVTQLLLDGGAGAI